MQISRLIVERLISPRLIVQIVERFTVELYIPVHGKILRGIEVLNIKYLNKNMDLKFGAIYGEIVRILRGR